jgi:NAD(P)-dependent dehydrogenase (short-subunit alcohol dehydrogenase family)
MSRTVRNATVVVAGLGRLGTSFALHAVADGAAHVIVWDGDRHALAAVEERLRAIGGETSVHVHHVDLGDAGAIAAAAQRVRHRIGRVDVVITDAAMGRRAFFWQNDAGEDIRRVMRVNALSAFYVTREFLPAMVSTRRGSGAPRPARILTVVPAPGAAPRARAAVAAAAAAAVTTWSKALRIELRRAGARHVGVTVVSAALPRLAVEQAWQAMLDGRPGPYLARKTVLAGVRQVLRALRQGTPPVSQHLPGIQRHSAVPLVRHADVLPVDEARTAPPSDSL